MKYARGGMTSLDYLIEIQRLEADVAKLIVENEKLLNKIAKIQFELDDVVSEWISVKDKLPEDGQEVFAYCSEADSFDMLVLRCLSENIWINRALDIYENVTHWMPLPTPPPKENEDV